MTSKNHITGICEISKGKVLINGELKLTGTDATLSATLQSAISAFQVQHPRFGKMDRLSQLGYTCCDILIQSHGKLTSYESEEIAILFCNNSSSLDTDYRYQESTLSFASPSLFVYTLPNILLAEVSIKHGIKGETLFLISDTYDEEFMCNYINQLFETHKAKVCITGWVDVLDEEYRGIVFMIEQNATNLAFDIDFTEENLKTYFKN